MTLYYSALKTFIWLRHIKCFILQYFDLNAFVHFSQIYSLLFNRNETWFQDTNNI